MKATLSLPPELSNMFEDLASLGEDLDMVAEAVLGAGADVAIAGMKDRVPKKKRTLLGTLRKGPVEHEGNVTSLIVGQTINKVETPAREAIKANVHEYGSVNMPQPHPFVRETMIKDKAKIYSAMKKKAKEFGLGND